MSDQFQQWDGAYVLGALSPEERELFEQHLLTCDDCMDRVRELAALPSLLGQLSDDDIRELELDDPVPDTLLPRLMRAAQARRRRGRVVIGSLVAAVAACAVTLAVVLWPTSSSPQAPLLAMHALHVGTPVQASVRLVSRSWGTEIEMHCKYIDGHDGAETYVLQVVGHDGVPQTIGWWTLGSGESDTFHSPTSLSRAQIDRVVLALPSKTPVLELDV